MRAGLDPDEDLTLFVGVWLACWRKVGGYVGLVDNQPRLWIRDPFDESLVAMLNALADAVPGGRQAMRERIAETVFIPVHE